MDVEEGYEGETDPAEFDRGVKGAIRQGRQEMASGDLIATGGTKDAPVVDDSGFTSQGRKEPKHWREEAKEKGTAPKIVRYTAPRSVEPTYKDPAVVHFGDVGRRLRADLAGLESRPDRERSELGYLRESGYQGPEVAELEARIRQAEARNAMVERIRRALVTGDRETLRREVVNIPRLRQYRDEL